jgi:hypothetical protein
MTHDVQHALKLLEISFEIITVEVLSEAEPVSPELIPYIN